MSSYHGRYSKILLFFFSPSLSRKEASTFVAWSCSLEPIRARVYLLHKHQKDRRVKSESNIYINYIVTSDFSIFFGVAIDVDRTI